MSKQGQSNTNTAQLQSNQYNIELPQYEAGKQYRTSLSTDVVESQNNWSTIQVNNQYNSNENSWQQLDQQNSSYPQLQMSVANENNNANQQYYYQYPHMQGDINLNANWCSNQPQMYYQYQNYPQLHQNTYYHQYPNYQYHMQPFHNQQTNLGIGYRKSEVIKLQNQREYGKCMGRGSYSGFRERGRRRWGCRKHKDTSSSSSSKEKGKKDKKNHNHAHKHHKKYESKDYKQKKHMQRSDTEHSQTEDQVQKAQRQMNQISLKEVQHQKRQNFTTSLEPFFVKYNTKQERKIKILNYLCLKLQVLQDIDPLICVLFELQTSCPQFFVDKYLNLFKIIKQIVKGKYQLETIKQKLNKIIQIKLKKENHDQNFKQKYPNPANIEFLQIPQLINLNLQKTIFLVDGNNIMQRQKKFRLYFQSIEEDRKAEGQIRLAWLFAESVKSQLFFDNKYSKQLYDQIKLQILSQNQEKMVNKVPVHFSDKHQNPNNTADMKIVQRLSQIVQKQEYKGYDIVLVSADRELAQMCNAITPIKKTSGIFIFKYCKKVIKQKYHHRPEMKGILKAIFTY